MNVLITGASGFVGKELAAALTKENKVTCMVRITSRISFLKKLGVKVVFGDVSDKDSLKEAVKDKDIIFHLVGIGSLSANSEEEFKRFFRVNVDGTKNLLDSILEHNKGVKKIIYLSSTAAVGLKKEPVDEETACEPKTPYQKSKYKSEELVQDYFRRYNLPISIIRPSMIYGPGGNNSEILRICRFVKKGIFPLFNRGDNAVPLVYITDFVRAVILVARKGKNGEVYFATNEEVYTMSQIVDSVAKALGKKAVKIMVPKAISLPGAFMLEKIALAFGLKPIITRERIDSMTTNRIFRVGKLKRLGYEQEISLDEGIKKTVEWAENERIL